MFLNISKGLNDSQLSQKMLSTLIFYIICVNTEAIVGYLIAINAKPVLVFLKDVLEFDRWFIVKAQIVENQIASWHQQTFDLLINALSEL